MCLFDSWKSVRKTVGKTVLACKMSAENTRLVVLAYVNSNGSERYKSRKPMILVS